MINEDTNVAPASDGYKLMKNVSPYYMGTLILCAVLLGLLPKEYEFLRMVAFGVEMLLVGMVVGHHAHVWSRPKLVRVRDSKN